MCAPGWRLTLSCLSVVAAAAWLSPPAESQQKAAQERGGQEERRVHLRLLADGRGIRHLIYEGFTIDEEERKAFDGALVQTGATGYGSFNERFAQPNELSSFTQTKFPFLYKTTTDPITGRKDGMGARIPAGLEPKLLLVDSGSEYWDRGRVAALRRTSPDGREDVEAAPNVRVYL